MGFFSWKTSEGKSIPNIYSGRPTFTVFMVLPNGERFEEASYEGYGEFGGKDYYAALSEINGGNGDKMDGITKEFADPPIEGLVRPRFTVSPDARWEDLKDPEDCPYQGYFYD